MLGRAADVLAAVGVMRDNGGVTEPTSIGGRPLMPPPGAPVKELLIARTRSQPGGLLVSALILIATAAAVGYFTGNLPSGFENWWLWIAGAAVVLLLVVIPWFQWLSKRYTITTRRVIVASGMFARQRTEMTHARGYTVQVRRGPLQRLRGTGTLTLSNGVDAPIRLINVPSVHLVHETLIDQVEVNQILAHRDATGYPTSPLA